MLALENARYSTDYSIELLDPGRQRHHPGAAALGVCLAEGDFTGSPTRWAFNAE